MRNDTDLSSEIRFDTARGSNSLAVPAWPRITWREAINAAGVVEPHCQEERARVILFLGDISIGNLWREKCLDRQCPAGRSMLFYFVRVLFAAYSVTLSFHTALVCTPRWHCQVYRYQTTGYYIAEHQTYCAGNCGLVSSGIFTRRL